MALCLQNSRIEHSFLRARLGCSIIQGAIVTPFKEGTHGGACTSGMENFSDIELGSHVQERIWVTVPRAPEC